MRESIGKIDQFLVPRLRRWGITLLRIALAIVFIWFGALKIFGTSPVVELVGSTVYFVDPDWFVPALGLVEVFVGSALAVRRLLRLVLLILTAQLAGTFLVFILLPDVAFQGANVLNLTVEGEFIVKNLVLIAAAMVVGARIDAPSVSGEVVDPDQGSAL